MDERERRIKIIRVSAEVLLEILRGAPEPKYRVIGIPDDADLRGGYIEWHAINIFCIRIRSDEFDPVEEGAMIPTHGVTIERIADESRVD